MDILVSWRKFSFKVLKDYYMIYIASGTCINPDRATQQSFKGHPLPSYVPVLPKMYPVHKLPLKNDAPLTYLTQ